MKRRNTENRKIIYQTIDELGHISLMDLNEYLLKKGIRIPTASLYRNIEVLENDGLIREVEKSGVSVYEIVARPHHYHFVCDSCKEIIDIPVKDLRVEPSEEFKKMQYQVSSYDVLIHGICPHCGKKLKKGDKKYEVQM